MEDTRKNEHIIHGDILRCVCLCAVFFHFFSMLFSLSSYLESFMEAKYTQTQTHSHTRTYVKREETRRECCLWVRSIHLWSVVCSVIWSLCVCVRLCVWYSDTYVCVDEYVHIQCQRSLLFRLFGSIIHFSIQTKAMAIEDEISIKKQKRL